MKRIWIVGGGDVGRYLARQLLARGAGQLAVGLIGNEAAYERARLVHMLEGSTSPEGLRVSAQEGWRSGTVLEILPETRQIRLADGALLAYDELVLATGARAVGAASAITSAGEEGPAPLPQGVFTLRSLADAEGIVAGAGQMAEERSCGQVLVAGGGMLGVEVASALRRRYPQLGVTLVHAMPHILEGCLDAEAAGVLTRQLAADGVQVLTGTQVLGWQQDAQGRVCAAELEGGQVLPCQLGVLCLGVVPDTALAEAAGVVCRNGVVVNEAGQTSVPHIYAVGDCTHHRYRMLLPAFALADVLTNVLTAALVNMQVNRPADAPEDTPPGRLGGAEPVQAGEALLAREGAVEALPPVAGEAPVSVPAAALPARSAACLAQRPEALGRVTLKTAHRLLVLGRLQGERCVRFERGREYARLVLDADNRAVGLVCMGDSPHRTGLEQAVLSGQVISAWARLLFRCTGGIRLTPLPVRALPDETLVCLCRQVSKGAVLQCAAATPGAGLTGVMAALGAGQGCGGCRPVLASLLGEAVKPLPWHRLLLGLAVVAWVLALGLLLWTVPYGERFGDMRHVLYHDRGIRELTGYGLLGISLLLVSISLFRRWGRGTYDGWKLVHSLLGLWALLGVALHSGGRLGSGLTYGLSLTFFLLLLSGALQGMLLGVAHKMEPSVQQYWRNLSHWAHVLALWPLPVLLGGHVLQVYLWS